MSNTPQTVMSWQEIEGLLGLTLPPKRRHGAAPSRQTTRPNSVAQHLRAAQDLMLVKCADGERTQHALRLAGALIAEGADLDTCKTLCNEWNGRNIEPLDTTKIDAICESIFSADLRNHPERHLSLSANDPLFDLNDGRIGRYLACAPPARRWLLDGLVVMGKAGAIVAPGGYSKSQWLLQLAVTVATGIDLAEYWKAGETGTVIYFAAEDDHDEIHRRLDRIQLRLTQEGKANVLAALQANLFVFSTVGFDTRMTKRTISGEVCQTEIVPRIVAQARQVEDLKLIIIDPISRFRGGEENSNEDATRFVEAMESIAQQTGASVLAAHHAGKASYGAEANQGASRGASALTDGLRWQMNLNPVTDKQGDQLGINKGELRRYVTATVTKTNYSAFPKPVMLERQEGGYLCAVTANHAQKQAATKAIVRLVRRVHEAPKPMTARQLELQWAGLGRGLGMSTQRLRDLLKAAIEGGFVQGETRKPLSVTPMGAAMLRDMPERTASPDDAMQHVKAKRREKVSKNQ